MRWDDTMPKDISTMSKKAGLPPGTLQHTDEKKTPAHVSIITYNPEGFSEHVIEEGDFSLKPDLEGATWIQVTGINDMESMNKIGDIFSIHPLVLEDVTSGGHHPKIEDYTDYLFIILQAFHTGDEFQAEQISMIVSEDFLISFQETPSEIFKPILDRIKNGKGRMRKSGTDFLAYTLIDIIIDNYFVILDSMGGQLEEIEEKLLSDPSPDTLWQIQKYKHKVMSLRRSIWPLREVVSALERGDFALITQSTKVYLRDVYDHTIQVADVIENFRDMLAGLIDIYLSTMSNKMNEVMKVLTIIATIFIPLTFIVGIYGMNFAYMPELQNRWGYPLILIIMIAIVFSMIIYFKKKEWL
jgi:magnesium transporter